MVQKSAIHAGRAYLWRRGHHPGGQKSGDKNVLTILLLTSGVNAVSADTLTGPITQGNGHVASPWGLSLLTPQRVRYRSVPAGASSDVTVCHLKQKPHHHFRCILSLKLPQRPIQCQDEWEQSPHLIDRCQLSGKHMRTGILVEQFWKNLPQLYTQHYTRQYEEYRFLCP